MPSAADIRAGGAFVELYTKNGPLYAGLKNAQRSVSGWSSNVMGAGRKLLGLGTMIAGPLVAASKVFASTGDNLDKMSGRTGVSVESLSELGFAAEQGGTDLGVFERSVQRMQKSLYDASVRGLKAPAEVLDSMGLAVDELASKDPEGQFMAIADAIDAMEDPTQKAGAAMQLFGNAGRQLLPMLSSLRDVRQQAKDLGLVVSTEDAQRAAKFTDQLNILRRVLMDGLFSAGSAVAPVLGEMVTGIVRVVKIGADWIDNNRQLFVMLLKIGGAILAGGAALMALGTAGTVVASVLGGIASVVATVGAVFSGLVSVLGFLLSPVAIFGALIGALGAVLGFLLNPITLIVGGLTALVAYAMKASGAAGVLADGFGDVVAAIRAGDISGAVTAAVDTVYQVLTALADWIGQWSNGAAAPIRWFAESFRDIATFAGEALGGVTDALMAGDIGAAVDVMWATIKLGFVGGMSWLRKQWAELRFFLVDMWGQAAFATLDTLNFLWSGMTDGFWAVADSIADAWKWAEKTLAKGIGWIIAKMEGLDPDDVIKNLEEDYGRQQAGRDADRGDRDKANQEAADARYTAIEASRQDWLKGANAKRDAQLSNAEAGLEDARQRFDAAKQAAKDARTAKEDAEKPPEEQPSGSKPPLPKAVEAASGFAASSSLGSLDFYKTLVGAQDPNVQIRKDQLAALQGIKRNTDPSKSKPVLQEAVPPKR